MQSAEIPEHEEQRLRALRETGILDTPPEDVFDDVAKLAAAICGTPIALVSLVDENRQWFKAHIGLDATETPRDVAFCAHAIHGHEVFVVSDAREDPRFADNPLVTALPTVVFYAGMPLETRDGYGLGTLCVIDHEPRVLRAEQLEALRVLGKQVAYKLELRRSSAALAQANADFAAFFDRSHDLLCVASTDGRLLRVNAAWELALGFTQAELLGRPLLEFVHEDDRARTQEELSRLAEGGRTEAFENRFCVRGGAHRWLRWTGAQSTDGRSLFGSARDVTEERAIQDALKRQREALARATEEANSANRLKSEFLANMSHELRTPLNGILGFAKLMHDGEVGEVNEQQREFLGLVLTSATHLLQLINDVLDLAKVEAGKLDFHPVSVDLNKVVGEICSVVRELAAKKRIRIAIELEPDACDLTADPARLKQVLYNYLSNAIKFTEPEGRITVRARAEGESVRLEVEDTGSGISAAGIAELFTDFHQLDKGAGKGHEGTGLGLALTKKLIEAQGGEVGVSSEVGVGSIFHATMPRRARIPVDSKLKVSAAAEPVLPAELPRVLVVEDDPQDRAWLRRTLGDAGYVTVAVDTGYDAIRRAEKERFDIITVDMFLPDMTGLDVLAAIRSCAPNRATPAVLVTVSAGHHVTTEPLEELDAERVQVTAQALVLKGAGAGASLVDVVARELEKSP